MPDEPENDNASAYAAIRLDGSGHAAMLLIESLIHGLIARSVLSVSDAVEIVETATDVKRDIGADRGVDPFILKQSIVQLESISNSLRHDLRG